MNISRDNGLDTLKSLAITLVLAWHLHPIKFLADYQSSLILNILNQFIQNVFEPQITLIAVPIFYIVSLYLFFQKNPNLSYLEKRIFTIGKLFIFWSTIQMIFAIIVTRKIPDFSLNTILGISPALPLVGDSVFYFLLNLIGLVIFSFLFYKVNFSIQKILSWLIIIFSLFLFEIYGLLHLALPYYNLVNFLIYIPISFALTKHKNEIFKFKYFYLFAWILFSFQDIYLGQGHFILTIYARISIVCGALTLFCFIYPLKIDKWYIKSLSKYSLGLFALHKYWQCILLLLLSNYYTRLNYINIGTPFNLLWLITAILVVVLSVFTILILKTTNLRQFVS